MKSTYYDNLAFRQELCPANIGKTVCDKVAMWAFWAVPGKNGFLWGSSTNLKSSHPMHTDDPLVTPSSDGGRKLIPFTTQKICVNYFRTFSSYEHWAWGIIIIKDHDSWRKPTSFRHPPLLMDFWHISKLECHHFVFWFLATTKKMLNLTSISYIFTVSLSHRNKTDFIKRGDIKGDFLTFRLHFVRQAAENNNSPYLSSEVELLK